MKVRGSFAVATALAAAGCFDLGRTVDTEGHVALVVERADGAGGSSRRLRGPALFRRLSQTTLLAVARFVREEVDGARRGDLYLRLVTAFPVADARFVGDVGSLFVDYVETARSGAVARYSGGGRARLDLSPATGAVGVAFELALGPASAPSATALRLRGAMVSEQGVVAAADLGAGLWIAAFDAAATLASPDVDFEAYSHSSGGDGAWVVSTPSDAPAGYGHFDFGGSGEVGAPAPDLGDPGGGGVGDSGGGDGLAFDYGVSASFDDDADGGCQGDKASQDTSECGVRGGGAGARGLAFVVALGALWAARRRLRRRL